MNIVHHHRHTSGWLTTLALQAWLLALVFLPACHNTPPPKLHPPHADQHSTKVSQKIYVDFFVDASGSMKGFFAKQSADKGGPDSPPPTVRHNYFSGLLEDGDNYLKAWPGATVHCWKFSSGKDTKPAPPTPIARLHDFFEGPEKFDGQKTYIEESMKFDFVDKKQREKDRDPDTPQVRIVLTDLFQNSADAGDVALELNKHFDETSAIGILGIRNPFYGPLFDLPEGKTLPAGSADSLPFYLLIAGPAPDVEYAIDLFEKHLATNQDSTGNVSDAKSPFFHVVFARHGMLQLEQKLIVPPVSAGRVPGSQGSYSEEDFVPGAKFQGVNQISFSKSVKVPLEMCMANGNLRSAGSYLFKVGTLHLNVLRWTDNWAPLDETTLSNAFVLEEGVPVATAAGKKTGAASDPASCPEETTHFMNRVLSVNHDALSAASPGFYLVQVDVPIDKEGKFAGLENWDLQEDDALALESKGKFDHDKADGGYPGRTLNLRKFLGFIQDKLFQQNADILLARYELYLKVKD